MANKSSKSSSFSILAASIAILLIAAGGLLYLQPGSGGSDSSRAELAALSQAIPLHAQSALAGDSRGFARLGADLKQLASARRTAALNIPGGSSSWDKLSAHAQTILAKRADVEATSEAAELIQEHMTVMLANTDALLDQSGATAVIQEFQQRGAEIVGALDGLAVAQDPVAAAGTIDGHMAYMRQVTDALSGASTEIDVVALDEATSEISLVPVVSELMVIEEQVSRISASAPQLTGLGTASNELSTLAGSLIGLPWPLIYSTAYVVEYFSSNAFA